MTIIPANNLETCKNTLKSSGIAKDMTDDQVSAIAQIGTEQRYPKGVAIVREDAKSRDLYIIRDGRVSIRLKLPSEFGKEEVIFQMRDCQIFGELALVDGSPRSATAFADEEVTAYRFDYDRLSKLLEEQPRIGYILMRNIASIIANRVRNTNMLWRNTLIW
ncbi:MAG: cyclic nucleotide-binding domain-containing protein [Candidatus Hatepunaea meridiana]|nr:cyclic nucleotide-binding domain-containing protein [Candidatus Hatepunaea meridiana]